MLQFLKFTTYNGALRAPYGKRPQAAEGPKGPRRPEVAIEDAISCEERPKAATSCVPVILT